MYRGRRDERPLDQILRDPATIDRFLAKVSAPDARGCRLWNGAIATRTGYGQFGIGQQIVSAHVAAHVMFVAPIPDGQHVLHRCDVRACVSPDHLFLGTQQVNMEDCAAKGRVNTQKLTADQVREIRTIYAQGGVNQAALGARFGIGQSQVHRIVNRQTWRFLD